MKRALGWTFGVALLVAALLSLLVGAALVFELPQHISSITVDGRAYDIHNLGAGHWLTASVAIFVVLLVLMLVVPLVIAIVLAVALLATALGLLAPALMLGIVALPLLALAALVVWLLRRATMKP